MNQTSGLNTEQKQVMDGMARAVETLRSTMSTVNKGGISVTVTAEPKVVRVKLPESLTNSSEIEKNICDAFNEAIKANAEKILALIKA